MRPLCCGNNRTAAKHTIRKYGLANCVKGHSIVFQDYDKDEIAMEVTCRDGFFFLNKAVGIRCVYITRAFWACDDIDFLICINVWYIVNWVCLLPF